ncbi:MAG: anaerobic glycerol-3-phosphate dehydrogenase subunit C [Parabacteroides sp.]|nr:anaerobic glycerol-3-phosphate dehydrogenase subunit C [Parabacteroides sp.]
MEQNKNDKSFEQCIKCTVCTVYCPVTAVNPEYPGPKQAGPDGERYRLKNPYFYDDSLDYCLNCKRCEVACPSNVKIGDIIQSARLKYSKKKPKLRDYMLANTDIMGSLATTFAPLVNSSLKLSPVKSVMDQVLAIDHHRTFPAYSGQKFETWFKKHAADKQETYKQHVSYFHGCYVNYNFPKQGKDLVKIMNAIGYGVHMLEKEKCCGVALIANNMAGQAKKQAEINISSIRKAVQSGQPVLTTSSTCTFTMRDEYPHILEVDNADVREQIMLATKFIFELVDEGKIKLAFKKDYRKRIAYHTPCHMEKLGWSIYSTSLLRMIPGVDFVMLDSLCCGIAGTYGFKKENYPYSQKIGEPLFNQIKELNVDLVATDCETCKWQIEMSAGVTVENPICILADALDIEETERLNK